MCPQNANHEKNEQGPSESEERKVATPDQRPDPAWWVYIVVPLTVFSILATMVYLLTRNNGPKPAQSSAQK